MFSINLSNVFLDLMITSIKWWLSLFQSLNRGWIVYFFVDFSQQRNRYMNSIYRQKFELFLKKTIYEIYESAWNHTAYFVLIFTRYSTSTVIFKKFIEMKWAGIIECGLRETYSNEDVSFRLIIFLVEVFRIKGRCIN